MSSNVTRTTRNRRLLALAMGVPYPPAGGGLLRTHHLLAAVAEEYEVVLAAFTYGEAAEAPPDFVRVVPVPWAPSRWQREIVDGDAATAAAAYEALAFDCKDPWFVSALDPSGMVEALESIASQRFDAVLLEGTPMATFVPHLPRGVPTVLDLMDVHTQMARRAVVRAAEPERAMRRREAERVLAFERTATHRADVCMAVSAKEAAAAQDLLGIASPVVVENGVDTTSFVPPPNRPSTGAMLFTGMMSYGPNVDAALYFAMEVLPLIRREEPRATFHVVGRDPTPEIRTLSSEQVVVHGRVSDMRDHYSSAELFVAPLREGGGTRLKILEAASSGCAIVTTSAGVEGLDLRHRSEVVVADSPDDMAREIVGLLRDPARRQTLGTAARRAVMAYDWAAIGHRFRAVLDDTVRRVRPADMRGSTAASHPRPED